MPETISKSRFKPQALKYFREIQEKGQDMIITDHGKPVLKISPFQTKPQSVLEELRNSVLRYDDPLEPVAQDDWDILKK
ncbi:Antitoxin component of toxin-antitoxin stability system, DNA-binding transcriptional repressor [Candidatus Electrothrix aarhusensis]|uniref:Antitoxin component of toxin-antitoxin stability system, DNA-binding transcriptional repressor n=1 Tax=Candidatus Electrothrix aarhusensis TaxID=1859131 RepID=A0A444J1Y5_9BACT|nr:Antitoxin component of toxin-antitoxin stability system, DNA-binding transcriptional repressor [Candidatus Electrothrix aarhusensis]